MLSILLKRKPRRRSRVIIEHDSPPRHHSLLVVVFRHRMVQFFCMIFQCLAGGFVLLEIIPHHRRNCFLGHIILCGTESTGGQHQITIRKSKLKDLPEPAVIVSNRIVIEHIDPKRIQFLRKIDNVGVDDLPEEDLCAHAD